MIYTELTCKAMMIAYNAHHGQLDKNGIPYIYHPFHIAEQMTDEYTVCAALLHDVCEDTDITISSLRELFPSEITDALKLLTHDSDMDYFSYIKALKENSIAVTVKLADLRHNSDISRFTDSAILSTPETAARLEKYAIAIKLLEINE